MRPKPPASWPPVSGSRVSSDSLGRDRFGLSPQRVGVLYPGGAEGGDCGLSSMICAQVPRRRLVRGERSLGPRMSDPSSARLCLARNERMRSRLKAARVNPRSTDIFTRPPTRASIPGDDGSNRLFAPFTRRPEGHLITGARWLEALGALTDPALKGVERQDREISRRPSLPAPRRP